MKWYTVGAKKKTHAKIFKVKAHSKAADGRQIVIDAVNLRLQAVVNNRLIYANLERNATYDSDKTVQRANVALNWSPTLSCQLTIMCAYHFQRSANGCFSSGSTWLITNQTQVVAVVKSHKTPTSCNQSKNGFNVSFSFHFYNIVNKQSNRLDPVSFVAQSVLTNDGFTKKKHNKEHNQI